MNNIRKLERVSFFLGLVLVSSASALPSPTKLTEKDTIVLAEFANRTGDQNFDGSLEEALRTALDESPFLRIFSAASLVATLRDMGRPVNTSVTPEIARAVCERAKCKAYVTGSIKGQGKELVLTLKVTDCLGGETLAEVQSAAQGQQKVLDALGEAVRKLRAQLGEPDESLRKFSTPLPQATTSSPEALRAWNAGIRARWDNGEAAAIPLLETAVKLDPNFASAIFALGLSYRNSGQEARAREFIPRAFALRERASVRDRFNIAGLYYSFVTVEYDKAVNTYREWIKAYPRDERPVSNLGSFYGDVCEYEQAIAQFTEARRMNPSNPIIHEDLIEILTATGQFGKAHEAYQQMRRMNLDTDAVHVFMYSLAVLEHDIKAVAREAGWFEGKPPFQHELLSEEADAEAYSGHLVRAREITSRAVQSALRTNNDEQAAGWQLNSAWREDLSGNTEKAYEQTIHALTMSPDSREDGAMAAILLARTGDVGKAGALEKDLEKRYPGHAVMQSYWLPCIRAQIALADGNPASALRELERTRPYDTLFPQVTYYSHMPSVVLRAEAYSALNQHAAAANEWERIFQHPGIVQLSATAPIAKLQFARASAIQVGPNNSSARAKARTAYEDFLSLWKDADSDIPIMKAAKAEFAKLNENPKNI
jgi:eukaryotic-like serine/threonine-protein kinase